MHASLFANKERPSRRVQEAWGRMRRSRFCAQTKQRSRPRYVPFCQSCLVKYNLQHWLARLCINTYTSCSLASSTSTKSASNNILKPNSIQALPLKYALPNRNTKPPSLCRVHQHNVCFKTFSSACQSNLAILCEMHKDNFHVP